MKQKKQKTIRKKPAFNKEKTEKDSIGDTLENTEKKYTQKVKIKIVGAGGAGSRIINELRNRISSMVEVIAVDTDLRSLNQYKARGIKIIPIGQEITHGLGTGMDPKLGREAAEAEKENLKEVLQESDIIFIVAGLGGGAGSGISPVIAQIAREIGVSAIEIIITSFNFEGKARMEIAKSSMEHLRQWVDILIAVSNDKLLSYAGQRPSVRPLRFSQALKIINGIICEGIQNIVEIIVKPGIINLDLADIRTILDQGDLGLIGIGLANGKDKGIKAAKKALLSPLGDFTLKEAKGILLNIASKKGIEMSEIKQAAEIITANINPKAKVIFGITEDRKLGDKIKVVFLATAKFGPKA